jgi:hypothetical protein
MICEGQDNWFIMRDNEVRPESFGRFSRVLYINITDVLVFLV